MGVGVYFIILLIVEAIFYAFHLSMLILLIVNRKQIFRGPFFSIFRIVLFADLICYVCLQSAHTLPVIPFLTNFYKSDRIVAHILSTIISYITVVQFLAHLLLAFNRFTLMYFSFHHQTLWKSQWYKIVLFGLPLLQLIWKIQEPTKFLFSDDDTVTIVLMHKKAANYNFIVVSVIYFSMTLFGAILNFLTISKYYWKKHTWTNVNLNEKNLIFVSFIIFIAQLFRTSFSLTRILFPTDQSLALFFNTIVPILYDVFAISGSVSLLLLSSVTRKEYLHFYRCCSRRNAVGNLNQ